MSVLFRLAIAEIIQRPARFIAIFLAVLMAGAFLSATATFSATSRAGLAKIAAAPLTTADIYVGVEKSPDRDPSWYRPIADIADVDKVSPVFARTMDAFGPERRGTANITSIPDDPQLRWFSLRDGDWPATPDAVVVDQPTADALGVQVGSQLPLSKKNGQSATVVVAGIADLKFRPLTGVSLRIYATPAFFGTDSPTVVLATVRAGASLDTTMAAVAKAVPEATVAPAAEQAEAAGSRFAGGSTQLTVAMLGFALVALLAAVMVIAGTFRILVAHRIRQIALLRLIGTRRGQVRAAVLFEALITGFAASVTGAALGVGGGYLGASALHVGVAGLRVSVLGFVAAVVVATGATVVAAVLPSVQATEVPPVQAMGIADETNSSAPTPGRRPLVVAGLAAAIIGGLIAVAGTATSSLALTIGGELVCAIGLLLLLPRFVRRCVPVAAAVLSRFGSSAALAARTMAANRTRSVAATSTVALGVGLVCALSVVTTSARASVDADLDRRYPVSVSVNSDGPIGGDIFAAIQNLRGINSAGLVRKAPVLLPGDGAPKRITEIPADLCAALCAGIGPDTVLLPSSYLRAQGLTDGQGITVRVGEQDRMFTAREAQLPDATGEQLAIVAPGVLDTLAPEAPATSIWAIAAAGSDPGVLASRIENATAGAPELKIEGSLSERRDIAGVLGVMIMLSLGMLLVTFAIAFLGLSNMLTLSVFERVREIALLRAIGTRKSRIRRAIAAESGATALLGALLGIAVGIPFGLVAVRAAIGRTAETVFVVSGVQLVGVLIVTLVIGTVAAAIPSVRAMAIQPAQGLLH